MASVSFDPFELVCPFSKLKLLVSSGKKWFLSLSECIVNRTDTIEETRKNVPPYKSFISPQLHAESFLLCMHVGMCLCMSPLLMTWPNYLT